MATMSSNDVLFEILSRLPAKAIFKFKTVNKLCLELTEESYFALKQSQNALLMDDSCLIIQQDFGQRYNSQTMLRPLPGEESSSGISNDVTKFLANSMKILASSNGLILCRATNRSQIELYIANPATNSCFPIPIPENFQRNNVDADLKIVFQCDKDDCMVFLFDEDSIDWSSNLNCKVYSPREGVWKEKEGKFFIGGRSLRFDLPVIHNGAIHFVSDCSPYLLRTSPYFWPYIMSYDIKNGTSRMLRVPKEARRGFNDDCCNMGIFKWGKISSIDQSICLVRLRKNVFTIWVLTNYELSLWQRILKVRVKAMGFMEEDPVVADFSVLNGDLLVFATKKKVYGYGLINEKYMVIEEICEHGYESKVCFIPYSNTLRTCGPGASTLYNVQFESNSSNIKDEGLDNSFTSSDFDLVSPQALLQD